MEDKKQESQLIMGKFKTVEDLEKSYKSLKDQYDNVASQKNKFIVPDEYKVNGDLELTNQKTIDKAKDHSKKYGYTQTQFENYLNSQKEKENKILEQKEKIKTEFENLEEIEKYIKEDVGLKNTSLYDMNIEDIKTIKNKMENKINTNHNMGNKTFSINGYSLEEKKQALEIMRNYQSNPTEENKELFMKAKKVYFTN